MAEVKRKLKTVGNEVTSCKNRSDIVEGDRFVVVMDQFHKEALDSFYTVEQQFQFSESLFEECARYFGESDLKKVTMDSMSACLKDFLANFELASVNARKERERKAALERRKKPEPKVSSRRSGLEIISDILQKQEVVEKKSIKIQEKPMLLLPDLKTEDDFVDKMLAQMKSGRVSLRTNDEKPKNGSSSRIPSNSSSNADSQSGTVRKHIRRVSNSLVSLSHRTQQLIQGITFGDL